MKPEDDLLLLVGRIDGKLDQLIVAHVVTQAVQAEHSKRIAIIEGWRKQVLVLAAAVGVAGSFFTHQLQALVGLLKGS